MAVRLEIGQDCPLRIGVDAAENSWHDGPGRLPAQFGTHPEATGATVRQGQEAEVFGGDSHARCCEALVHWGQGRLGIDGAGGKEED